MKFELLLGYLIEYTYHFNLVAVEDILDYIPNFSLLNLF